MTATEIPAVDTEPRITPGTRHDVGILGWAIAEILGRVSGTNPPNLFLTLGRSRALFRGWLRFAARLMPAGKLPRRETELVILRIAHLRDCVYEFEHHRHLAQSAGVTEADIAEIMGACDGERWSERERVMLRNADALHARGDLDDDEWTTLAAHLDDAEIIEFVMLVGHYEMLATTIKALRVQSDTRRG